ncbi:hypothetical protein V2J56_09190 [Georgenia sp. MJ206]|uniref:hypothetical protein n=1 Tax=Georgenia wangjunii TaxID=3117730 RepID=UPI002F269AB5
MTSIAADIEARLETLPWPVYDSDATGATNHPYILLLPPVGGLDPEHTLGGARTSIVDTLMVRAVALTGDAVRGVLQRSRTVLSREGRPLTFDVDGAWRVTLTREPGRVEVLVDRDVPETGTGKYPLFATDTYELRAVPL